MATDRQVIAAAREATYDLDHIAINPDATVVHAVDGYWVAAMVWVDEADAELFADEEED